MLIDPCHLGGFSLENHVGVPAFLSNSTMTESEDADFGDPIGYGKIDDSFMVGLNCG